MNLNYWRDLSENAEFFKKKSWINKEPENTDFIISLEHFGYKGKVFEIVYRERERNELLPLITVEAFDKYSKNLVAQRSISSMFFCGDLKFEINRLKEVLKNTMITSEDIYK